MIHDELDLQLQREGFLERHLGLGLKTFLIALLGVIALGMYVSVLLFGNNSIEVLLQLDEYKSYLADEIDELKRENASLQKEYFELKELDTE